MATQEWVFRSPRKVDWGESLALLARVARVVVRVVTATPLVLVFAAVMAVFVPNLFGYKLMAVTSGSMSPSIHVGDALYVRTVDDAATQVETGDVITFSAGTEGGMKTHRVIASKQIDGMTWFQTQGDANREPDVDLTPADSVYGVMAVRVPSVGPALIYATGPRGKLVLIGVPAALLMLSEINRLARRRRPLRAVRQSSPIREAAPVSAGVKAVPAALTSLSADWPTPKIPQTASKAS
jgi:signal peptidase